MNSENGGFASEDARHHTTWSASERAEAAGRRAAAPGEEAGQEAVLEQLRSTVDELAKITQRRAARLNVAAQSTIRAYPWTTIGIAALGGALIGTAVFGRRSRSARSEWYASLPSVSLPPISYPSGLLVDRKTIADYAERAADAISSVDPQAFSAEKLGALRELASRAWSGLTKRSSKS